MRRVAIWLKLTAFLFLWLVEMELGPKTFAAATSWEALQLANAEPEQHYTFYDYLVQCFPSLQGAKRKILEAAFQRCQLDEMIELMWDDENDLRTVSKEYYSTLTYHATSPLRVPSIRQFGLRPSKQERNRPHQHCALHRCGLHA